jgi:hypothetical protein
MTKRDAVRLGARITQVLVLLAALGCVATAPVMQGRVATVDSGAKTITVQDELKPSSPPVAFDLSTAEMGSAPAVGDQVRLVYKAGGGSNVVLRLMNLTQQEGQKKEG